MTGLKTPQQHVYSGSGKNVYVNASPVVSLPGRSSASSAVSQSPDSAVGHSFAPSSRDEEKTVNIEDGSAEGEGRKRVASDWGYNFKLWSMYEQRAGASSGRDR